MAGTNDFKAIASGVGANVITQPAFEALSSFLANGYSSGVVASDQFNKVIRQSSFIAAAIGQFVANANINAVDDGDVAGFAADLLAAINSINAAIPKGGFKKLSISAAGTGATITVSCDELPMSDGAGGYVTESNVSGTITTTNTGANGLDTGALATSTWYSIWRIGRADGTRAWLLSLSATSPTMPSGYTYKARIGWFRTDGTANKYPLAFKQIGGQVRYVVNSGSNVTGYPLMASGAQGSVSTPTWIAVGVSNFVPSTASIIHMVSVDSLGGETILSTNGQHGTYTNSANVPSYTSDAGTSGYGGSQAALLLESTNIYRAASGGHLVCTGWEDFL
jgi:hypothetical protein